jgi:alkanesulfonate monooxygenase SsuD/methylene tetrahydromethanopterin reductase-like flavin-dependent oxidoreductase (luciferase family)
VTDRYGELDRKTPRFAIKFDLRAPAFGRQKSGEIVAAALDQCSWADRLGFELVFLHEHHGTEDGYLPAPIVFASAVAARTKRLTIRIGAIVAPFYSSVRLAEDLAVVDLVSRGRLEVVLAAGYARHEFEMLDVPMRGRSHVTAKAVSVLRDAWSGEPFVLDGRTVRVTPRPHRPGGPPIFLGGSSEGAARRAAALGVGFQLGIPGHPLWEVYRREMIRLGRADPGPERPRLNCFLHVANDPERAWAQIEPYARHELQQHSAWVEGNESAGDAGAHLSGACGAEGDLCATGAYSVFTPERAVDYLSGLDPATLVTLQPMMGGLDPCIAWESLDLLEREVMPRLRSRKQKRPLLRIPSSRCRSSAAPPAHGLPTATLCGRF